MAELPWYETPEWHRYTERVRRELVPKMAASQVVMSILPPGQQVDVQMALELGMAIMLDKPVVAMVEPGTKVPDHLVRVADHIVEADIRTKAGRDSAAKRLAVIMAEMNKHDGATDPP